MLRFVAALSVILLLGACSPRFDWRPVAFGQQGVTGVLPDRPETQTQDVPFETHVLALTMRSAKAGSVLFALGGAPLPAALADDPPARERLARWAIGALYRNAGVEPPAALPAPGTRFAIEGRNARGPLRFEAEVVVTATQWLEAVVIAAPADFNRAPVGDFWLSLRLPAHTAEAGTAGSQ